MNRKHWIIIFLALIFHGGFLSAQEAFVPSGSPHAKVFFNFHSGVNNDERGFNLTRAYLGYEYRISERFSADVTFDVGTPEVAIGGSPTPASYELIAFLKIAELAYESGHVRLTAGMIGLEQFKIQEDYWGFRYIEESFQDLYELGPSADLGAMAAYDFTDWLSVDAVVRNGEGYKRLQSDNALNAGLGISLKPVEGLVVRGYYDCSTHDTAQYSLAHFIGYKNGKTTVGAEYNIQLNHQNLKNHDLKGYSLFGSWSFTDRWRLFARYDKLSSNAAIEDSGAWNVEGDGRLMIGGVEYSPVDAIKIALDYQAWNPADKSKDDRGFIFLNFEYVF